MQLFMCMTHDTEIPLTSHTDKHTHISPIISEGSPYPWTLFSVLWVPQGNSWSSPVTPSMDDDEAVGGSSLRELLRVPLRSRDTVDLGGASRASTVFGVMEEGLISSGVRNLSLPLQF